MIFSRWSSLSSLPSLNSGCVPIISVWLILLLLPSRTRCFMLQRSWLLWICMHCSSSATCVCASSACSKLRSMLALQILPPILIYSRCHPPLRLPTLQRPLCLLIASLWNISLVLHAAWCSTIRAIASRLLWPTYNSQRICLAGAMCISLWLALLSAPKWALRYMPIA